MRVLEPLRAHCRHVRALEPERRARLLSSSEGRKEVKPEALNPTDRKQNHKTAEKGAP